jgi:phage shock protein A
MGLFKRISDIISANLNDLTDGLEDPEVMLKQATREMQASIAEVTQQTARVMAGEKTMARELQRNRDQVRQWEERAQKAVEAGDDALARKALVRKNEHDKIAAALEDQLQTAAQASLALRRQLAGMQAKLAEAKRSLSTLSIRKRAADFRKKMDAQAAGLTQNVDDGAFEKFDRLKAKVEQAEAEAEAVAELRAMQAGSDQPEDVAEIPVEAADVDAELAELKRKMKR